MKSNEGLPLIKLMMLLSSMAPLFILIGIKGFDHVICDKYLWIAVSFLVVIPYLFIWLRIYFSKKSNDTFLLDVSETKTNREYLFTYLITILLPLFSVTITTNREFVAMISAIFFVVFVLWNMNLHFINILFAILGYRVYTIDSYNCSVLLTKRTRIPSNIKELKVHRISNSVFIELKNYKYAI